MSTAYYALLNCCEHCHRPEEIIFIGRSAIGHRFYFNWNGARYYQDYESFKAFLAYCTIKNEYGEFVEKEWLTSLIESKQDEEFTPLHDFAAQIINDFIFVDNLCE